MSFISKIGSLYGTKFVSSNKEMSLISAFAECNTEGNICVSSNENSTLSEDIILTSS